MNNISLRNLHNKLKEEGFTGSLDRLRVLYIESKRLSELEEYEVYMNCKRNSIKDKDKLKAFDDFMELVRKITLKYEGAINANILHGSKFYLRSKKKEVNGKSFIVFIKIKDNTNSGNNGFYGTFEANISYGYGENRKDKNIVFIEKEKY